MGSALEVFALAVLALGIGALGLAVVYEGTRLTAASSRLALVRRRVTARRTELDEVKHRTEDTESRATAQQTTLDRLTLERSRLGGVIKSVLAGKVELIHELGEPDGASGLFESDLRTVPEFARIDPHRIVFAREIWERRNLARVWADSPEGAMVMLQRPFNLRSGVLPGRLQRVEGGLAAANRKSAP